MVDVFIHIRKTVTPTFLWTCPTPVQDQVQQEKDTFYEIQRPGM